MKKMCYAYRSLLTALAAESMLIDSKVVIKVLEKEVTCLIES